MKVTFYGSIALAAIAAQTIKAASLLIEEEIHDLDFAQSEVGPMSLKAETGSEISGDCNCEAENEVQTLATLESEAWTELDSDVEADLVNLSAFNSKDYATVLA